MYQKIFSVGLFLSIITLIAFIIISAVIMFTRRTGKEKQLWFHRISIIGSILFAVVVTCIAGSWNKPFALLVTCIIAYPTIVLSAWLNIRRAFFCNSCSKMSISQNPFSPLKFCPKCGAKLNNKHP